MRFIVPFAQFILLLVTFPASAQSFHQFYFTHYATSSGLLSSEVNAAIQDKDGFIWVGTNDGLQRYDGTRFRNFRFDRNNPSSIPSNLVWQLLLDKKNNLWLLTAEGHVGIFDTKTLKFKEARVTTETDSDIRNFPKKVVMDEYGNMFYILLGKTVLTLDAAKHEFSWKYNFFPLPATGVSSFVQEPGTKNYWMGIQGKGLAIYNDDTKKFSLAGNNIEHNPAIDLLSNMNSPYNLFFDSKNRLWIQTWGAGFPSIYIYNNNTKQLGPQIEFITTLKSYYETHSFFEQKDGSIWVVGLGILGRYKEDERNFELVYNGYKNERSISYERVNCIFEDRENNLWVGTNNNGLYRFNPEMQFFTNVAHINRTNNNAGKGSVLTVTPTKWGTFLATTWGDGIYQYDKNFNLLPINISGINTSTPSIWSACLSRDSNHIWMSGQPGIHVIDQQQKSSKSYYPPQLENRTVRQIAEDRQGNLWLGMQGFGVFKWNASEGKTKFENGIHRFDKIPVAQVNKVMVDSHGLVWVGMAAHGVYVIDPVNDSIVLHFTSTANNELHLPEDAISSILEYSDSSMIFTTSVHIVVYNRYNHRSLIVGSTETLSGIIASIEKDKAGNLWVATTAGIFRVNTKNRVFIKFNRDDGIDNDHFTLAASRLLPDGRIVFGSSDQFVVFDPAAIILKTAAPKVVVTDFKVMSKSLQVDSLMQLKQIRLSSNNNSIVIEFSPLTYSSANLIKYKLEGLDKQWRIADKNNQAIYSYLPPGKYIFHLMAVDEGGDVENVITSMTIRISPPFWKSWWFFSLIAIATGAVFFWIDRERLKRKQMVQKMRSDIASNLHEQVNTALNNINILSEMARLKADKDPAKSKEYIEQIHTKSHNMIIAMDDMLWSINPHNDNMAKTTERMREYIDALQTRYGVSISMEVDKKVESLELNMKLRHDAFLWFKEGIKNLVTVGAKTLHVFMSIEKNILIFMAQFDTEGCDMKQLNNLLHRQDLEHKLTTMNATIDVSVQKTSSTITLEIPVS